jgi:hypothetical protein
MVRCLAGDGAPAGCSSSRLRSASSVRRLRRRRPAPYCRSPVARFWRASRCGWWVTVSGPGRGCSWFSPGGPWDGCGSARAEVSGCVCGFRVVAPRQLRPRVGDLCRSTSEGGRLPGMRQAGADRTAGARPPRRVARRAGPRSGRRTPLHAQRRPRPLRGGAVVGAAGLVAVCQPRPRVGGEPTATDGVSVVRRTPGAARAVARRQAPRSRRRAAPEPQRRPGSVRDRRVLVAKSVVALQELRPGVEDNRGGALDGGRRLPKLPKAVGSPATVPGRPAARYRRQNAPSAAWTSRRPTGRAVTVRAPRPRRGSTAICR